MNYKVTSTEKNNKKASEFETKTLLFLLNNDLNNELFYFPIDFFNDVSGVNEKGTIIWDAQSKGKKLEVANLGNALITLFKNYISNFKNHFIKFFLYAEKINENILINKNEKIFGLENIKNDYHQKIKQKLINEAKEKTYIKEYMLSQKDLVYKIEQFLEKVKIVVNYGRGIELIKKIMNYDDSKHVDDSYFDAIFTEIRDAQSAKKNIFVEGEIISNVLDFKQYNKFIGSGDIFLMITNRIINIEILNEKQPPFSFHEYLSNFQEFEERKKIVEKCVDDIYRIMFNRNNKKNYWTFLNETIKIIKSNPSFSVEQIYKNIDKKLIESFNISEYSIKYFICGIKDGVEK